MGHPVSSVHKASGPWGQAWARLAAGDAAWCLVGRSGAVGTGRGGGKAVGHRSRSKGWLPALPTQLGEWPPSPHRKVWNGSGKDVGNLEPAILTSVIVDVSGSGRA